MSKDIQRFAIAHELGHAILHSKEKYILFKCLHFNEDKLEKEADIFANKLIEAMD